VFSPYKIPLKHGELLEILDIPLLIEKYRGS